VFLAFGLVSEEAEANVLEDLAKSLLRPDLDLQEALVAVLDARSGLKEIQASLSTLQIKYSSPLGSDGFS